MCFEVYSDPTPSYPLALMPWTAVQRLLSSDLTRGALTGLAPNQDLTAISTSTFCTSPMAQVTFSILTPATSSHGRSRTCGCSRERRPLQEFPVRVPRSAGHPTMNVRGFLRRRTDPVPQAFALVHQTPSPLGSHKQQQCSTCFSFAAFNRPLRPQTEVDLVRRSIGRERWHLMGCPPVACNPPPPTTSHPPEHSQC